MKFFAVVAGLASLMVVSISADSTASTTGGLHCGTIDTCSTKRDPVCGSNRVTYRNMCVFNSDNCFNGLKWTAKSGDCPGFHRTGRE
ncbi:hypothetical protein PF010_g15711 [Phytophthora fragariae]|nr:hypothetical protein PF003_g29907 [Phytophthora fragariae]KAE9098059.1 hypothetical protein PF010_g15711 [Phytophthora fragariae]